MSTGGAREPPPVTARLGLRQECARPGASTDSVAREGGASPRRRCTRRHPSIRADETTTRVYVASGSGPESANSLGSRRPGAPAPPVGGIFPSAKRPEREQFHERRSRAAEGWATEEDRAPSPARTRSRDR